MTCQKCYNGRILSVCGKTSDMCFCEIDGKEEDGYVPEDCGIGGGDYVEFKVCLNCGQIQGEFPLPLTDLESSEENESSSDEDSNEYGWD